MSVAVSSCGERRSGSTPTATIILSISTALRSHSLATQRSGELALTNWRCCLEAGDSIAHFALGYTLYDSAATTRPTATCATTPKSPPPAPETGAGSAKPPRRSARPAKRALPTRRPVRLRSTMVRALRRPMRRSCWSAPTLQLRSSSSAAAAPQFPRRRARCPVISAPFLLPAESGEHQLLLTGGDRSIRSRDASSSNSSSDRSAPRNSRSSSCRG